MKYIFYIFPNNNNLSKLFKNVLLKQKIMKYNLFNKFSVKTIFLRIIFKMNACCERFIMLFMFFMGLNAVCFLFCTQVAYAVEQIRPLMTDNRIKVVAFQKHNVVPVKASTFTTTQIIFGNGEIIENIQNGDLDAWTVSVQKGLSNMLFLKPTIADSNTNMTVVTNRHIYYFHLMSAGFTLANQVSKQMGKNTGLLPSLKETADGLPDVIYAIQFIYPSEERKQMLANLKYNKQQRHAILNAHKHPKNYNWDYSFHGSREIMPLHIFDDGRFTYMQLRTGQSIPAIFAVNNRSGKESVVNYRRRGQYIVIQRIAPQFTLRDGRHTVASIFNNSLIHRLEN